MTVGYCTNVHAGTSLNAVNENLLKHSVQVRNELVRSDSNNSNPLPVGLWLSNQATMELGDKQLLQWRDWLAQNHLLPYTFNGFPYSDFHQTVVKHDVYLPTWAERSRLDYTVRLANILNCILPANEVGTISTLPLGWPQGGSPLGLTGPLETQSDSLLVASAKQLKQLAIELDRILQADDRLIKVGIEPEPGCVLDSAEDIVNFFQRYLFDDSDPEIVRRHIGVCHDVCHSAVMFESQQFAVEAYRNAKIDICKVQVSSAVEGVFDGQQDAEVWTGLREFAEPKYLHQTCVRDLESSSVEFFEDLNLAIEQINDPAKDTSKRQRQLRVHFHVPIFMKNLGVLNTTQAEITECLAALRQNEGDAAIVMPHFEVETYAWNVLPEQYQRASLASGIAEEINWFNELLDL